MISCLFTIDRIFSPNAQILLQLCLLLIPFLPVSGIVVVGTLLAERLLYLPSVGYCMLLANVLMRVCRNRVWLFRVLSLAIVFFYSFRTVTRNPAWKDDKTLFLDSYRVCPDSAKLNLQISKLYVNEGNLKLSRKHLERAKRIDPDFCDVGYEEALILLMEGNTEAATKVALQNLGCIYTSRGSFEILNTLWSQRLAANPQSIDLVVEIAEQCEEHGLAMIAITKYMSASQLALQVQ